ncbi:MAG TPA: GNAT family N-acetyltransferase [Sphingomonas sp.]|nr:GNAT family N-acetyltransferase [Sphingomonas sp.]
MPCSVKWFDDLDAVAADAGDALDRLAQPCLFDRLSWFRLTHAHVCPAARLAVARARRIDASAWLFLIETAPRSAAPLASWYTLRFAPVLAGETDPALLQELNRAVRRRFDRISLHPLSGERPSLDAAGWRSFASRISTNWTIDLADRDFDTYWASRPSQLRNTIARRTRSHPVRIAIHRHFDELAWLDYEAIYAASWKPQEGSPAFLRALAEQEGASGTLRLGIAYDGGDRPVAAQFWLMEGGIATIHKLAHREDARAGSPGSLLSHAMFRAAIDEDRVTRIDFGLGNESYKADWVDMPRPIVRIDAYHAASLRGLAGMVREVASRLARRRALD